MPLAAQLAKLLTKGAREVMSFPTGSVMKHEPTMRVLTPEQEAASYAPIRTSSYELPTEELAPIAPVETPITPIETDVVPPVRAEIDEATSEVPQLYSDIPAGPQGKEWLERKILLAQEKRQEYRDKGQPDSMYATLGGMEEVTGYFREPLLLDPKALKRIKGAQGEEKIIPGEKLRRLKGNIAEEGYFASPDPINIMVREDGVPFVYEGNNRLFEAIESGRSSIPVRLNYLRGAENVDGPLSPDKLPSITSRKIDEVPPVRTETDELVPTVYKNGMEYVSALPAKSIMMKEGESFQYTGPLEVKPFVIPGKSSYIEKFGNPSTSIEKTGLPENIIKDTDNNPILVYRGMINSEDKEVESMLSGESRENYASFFTNNPDMAATYAGDKGGFLTPFFIKPKRVIEFPVNEGRHGRHFDKFEFDRRAKKLKTGEILRAHNVIDAGPRHSPDSDPLNKWSFGSDVYAIKDTGILINAISKRAEMDELVPPAVPDRPPIRRQVEDLGLSKKEQEIIRSTIDQPLYHTSRSAEKIETFDPEKLKQKAIKGNIASGLGLYTTPSLLHSRANYYTRIIPQDIQNKYIQKGEVNKLVDAEELYRQGKLSPEEIEDLIYDAYTYEIKLNEDFNPIVILNKKDRIPSLKKLTAEERDDFLIRNPDYEVGPIIKHKGVWKSQQELEEIGFEGVIDAREKFLWKDKEGKSKHEVVVWPSALSKVKHKLMRGIGAREVKPKKGKTRKEIEIQGGPLSGKVNEQEIGRILDDHNIEWEYNDNGGITAIEEFSKGPSRKKSFKRNTSLKTVRDWLGYAKGGVVDMRNGGKVGAAVVAASLMASGGQAMDMRNGGVVGMVHGGPVHDGPVLAKRQAAVDYGGLEQPSLTVQNTASDIFVTNVGKTEGTTWHPDAKGIYTSPYGIRTDLHKDLLDDLQAKAGVSKWEDIPLKDLKQAAMQLFKTGYLSRYEKGQVPKTTAATFNNLSEGSKFLIGSSTYHGSNWPSLTNNLSKWEKDPTIENLEGVISQTIRSMTNKKGVKVRTRGFDNRAVRDLEIAGIIDKSNSRHRTALRKWLPLTTEVEFPTPSVPRSKPTKP